MNQVTAPHWQQPRPLPRKTLPLKQLAVADLPKSCQPFIEDVALRLQCPLEYAAAPFIVGFSALVGRRLALRIHDHDDWLVIPNLWGAVVGPSGSMKTAAFRRALAPLEELQTAAFSDYHAALAAYKQKRSLYHRLDPNALRLPTPMCRRYIVGDVTLEKLTELLRENPSGLLYFRDDLLGWLRAMSRDRQDSARAFYRQAFNGDESYLSDRVLRGSFQIHALCLSVLGGLEPTSLEGILTSSRAASDGHKFFTRLQILFWPDTPADWQFLDPPKPTDHSEQIRALFARIAAGELDSSGLPRDERTNTPFVHFTPAARELYRDWRIDLEKSLRTGELPDVLQSHLARYRSMVPSLALLFGLLDRGAADVDDIHFALARRWQDVLWTHAHKAYAPIIQDTPARRLLHKLTADRTCFESFNLRDLRRCHWSGLDDDTSLTRAITTLLETGHICATQLAPNGRPRRYELNPLAE